MGETDKSYWLLSETSGIGETRDPLLERHLPLLEGLRWLSAGWRDFWTRPASSIAYGVGVFLLSVAFVWTLVEFGRDYILFPSLAGFLIVAPFLAMVVAGRAGTVALRNVGPWRSRSETPKDAVQNLAVINPGHAANLIRQKWRHDAPFKVAQFISTHPSLQKKP